MFVCWLVCLCLFLFPTSTCGVYIFCVVTIPPSASSRRPLATKQLPRTNFQQPIVNNQLSSTNIQQPIFNNQLSTTNHQPIVINELSPTNYDLLANCLLDGVGRTPWRWMALLGLRRCSAVICARGVQKHCALQGFVGVEDPQLGQWRNAKTVGFTRVVSVLRASRTCIIGISLLMRARQRKCCKVHRKMSQTEAPKIG